MLKIPTRELIALIDCVLAKHQWTQTRLSQELNVGPETVSRWRSGSGIHKAHYEELKRLSGDAIADSNLEVLPVRKPLQIPFSVTIPKRSISIVLDENGDFNITGLMSIILEQKEK